MQGQVSARVLEKLEWPSLLAALARYGQTEEGKAQIQAQGPTLDRDAILDRWSLVEPLKHLAIQGFKAPIGDLATLSPLLRGASLGQILDGPSLLVVAASLDATRKVHAFAHGLEARCSTLRKIKSRLLPMPKLLHAITKSIGPDGDLRDDASPELTRIRRQKVNVRRRIEDQLTQLMQGGGDAQNQIGSYLQDNFFTLRAERYVLPVKIDGRGRVAGKILDTSTSGQTIFLEPAAIAPLNDQLLDLDVEEKLEIARIFRDLSQQVAADAATLGANHAELIALDVLTAEALLAAELRAGPIEIIDQPGLDLRQARHPLIRRPDDQAPLGSGVACDAHLLAHQHILIISGPNAGGKTVVLKTVGLLHLMVKSGLMVPAAADSRMFLFQNVWLELGDAQSLSANLSTFSGHLAGLKPILVHARPADLVLLDELAVGTDPQTGAAIGTAILEELANRGIKGLVTTHFDALKSLAISDPRFRNGSMEFALSTLSPTYHLVLDVPGQSYGLEVAEQIGLPASVVVRARDLRHGSMSNLDRAVTQLMAAREQALADQKRYEGELLRATAERDRWQHEVELLQEQRRKISQQMADKYEARLDAMRQEFGELLRPLRQAVKDQERHAARPTSPEGREQISAQKRAADKALATMGGVISEIRQTFDAGRKLPGMPAERSTLEAGSPVYVLPLKKIGKVLRIGVGGDDSVEVEVGVIKLRVSLHDLRLMSPGEAGSGAAAKKNRPSSKPMPASSRMLTQGSALANDINLTLGTPTNSLDLRGKDGETAIQALWNFLDLALRHGEEYLVVIHGHGEGKLKAAVRTALSADSPYPLRFRPGLDQEGGDGVTVIRLDGES